MGGRVSVSAIVLYVVLPVAHFLYWYNAGRSGAGVGVDCGRVSVQHAAVLVSQGTAEVDCGKQSSSAEDVSGFESSAGLSLWIPESDCATIDAQYDGTVLETVPTHAILDYKARHLAELRLPEDSLLLNVNKNEEKTCTGFKQIFASQKGGDESCIAIVHAKDLPYSYNVLRFKGKKNDKYIPPKKNNKNKDQVEPALSNQEKEKEKERRFVYTSKPSGFFNQVPDYKGRDRLRDKMHQLLDNLPSIEQTIRSKLERADLGLTPASTAFAASAASSSASASKNIEEGDSNSNSNINSNKDVVVMTVNDGEMDLLSNFACSCHHHNVSTRNMLVFAGSEHILESIEAMGFVGLYDNRFATVSKQASGQYLDSIFVDMMWYKSFSVWILLKMGYNVLFQDVDLVWFRDPFSYFKEHSHLRDIGREGAGAGADDDSSDGDIKKHYSRATTSTSTSDKAAVASTDIGIDGYFSDDGQRGLRYSPFYANSGFYFLRHNSRSLNFAWSVRGNGLCLEDYYSMLLLSYSISTTILIITLKSFYIYTAGARRIRRDALHWQSPEHCDVQAAGSGGPVSLVSPSSEHQCIPYGNQVP